MRIFEVLDTDENIGPAPAGVCSKPTKDLPSSWVASCKSQGKRRRTGNRVAKLGGKTKKVAGYQITQHNQINHRPNSEPFAIHYG